MIALFIVLASIAAYFGIGFYSLRVTVPLSIKKHYAEAIKDKTLYPYTYGHKPDSQFQERAVEKARIYGIRGATIWGWPIAIPYSFATQPERVKEDVFTRLAPWHEEEKLREQQRKLQAREDHIRQLERDLNIKD